MRSGTRALDSLRRQLEALEAEPLEDEEITDADREQFDWYGPACGCGVPLGDCERHHRARLDQRPPDSPWRQWMITAGRGSGKTKAGAEWVRHTAETMPGARIGLVAGTRDDVVKTMLEGPSGIMSICPEWAMPSYHKTRLELTWPNGSKAFGYSAEEPSRLRGPQFSHAWCDELAHWKDAEEAWRQLTLTNRVRSATGTRVMITSTPVASPLIRRLAEDPKTVLVRVATYANAAHLDPDYLEFLRTNYEGTKWGQQEVYGQILHVGGHNVYDAFDSDKHVLNDAAWSPSRGSTFVTVDCGSSLATAALWWQLGARNGRKRLTVFSELVHDHRDGSYALAAAQRIKAHGEGMACRDGIRAIYLDPHGQGDTGVGPAAQNAYEATFNYQGRGGDRVTRWQGGREVPDSVQVANHMFDLGDIVIHPDCKKLIEALQTQQWQRRRGLPTDKQEQQHPGTDLCDALRGATIVAYPEGIVLPPSNLKNVPVTRFF